MGAPKPNDKVIGSSNISPGLLDFIETQYQYMELLNTTPSRIDPVVIKRQDLPSGVHLDFSYDEDVKYSIDDVLDYKAPPRENGRIFALIDESKQKSNRALCKNMGGRPEGYR